MCNRLIHRANLIPRGVLIDTPKEANIAIWVKMLCSIHVSICGFGLYTLLDKFPVTVNNHVVF